MADAPGKVPRCVVCALPAERYKCVKCKTPYCSVACQTVDWKERGHTAEATRWYERAAAKGCDDSKVNLAILREAGPPSPPA